MYGAIARWTYIDTVDGTRATDECVLVGLGVHVVYSNFKVRVRRVRELFGLLVITDSRWMIYLVMNSFTIAQLSRKLVSDTCQQIDLTYRVWKIQKANCLVPWSPHKVVFCEFTWVSHWSIGLGFVTRVTRGLQFQQLQILTVRHSMLVSINGNSIVPNVRGGSVLRWVLEFKSMYVCLTILVWVLYHLYISMPLASFLI